MLWHAVYHSAFFAHWRFDKYCSLALLNRNGVTASENQGIFESGGGRRSAIPVAVNPPERRGCLAGITQTSVPESGSVVAKYRFTWRHQAPQFIRLMHPSFDILASSQKNTLSSFIPPFILRHHETE